MGPKRPNPMLTLHNAQKHVPSPTHLGARHANQDWFAPSCMCPKTEVPSLVAKPCHHVRGEPLPSRDLELQVTPALAGETEHGRKRPISN